jgi:hypothetical protein
MQAVMESGFDISYLVIVTILGTLILKNSSGQKEFILMGIMSLVLGFGDAFHLVPRIISLNASSGTDYTAALGFGTLVTSITMTIFYVLLYHVWLLRYHPAENSLRTIVIYGLSIIRIAICLLPQNNWTSADAPYIWGIYRNIPFAILGIVEIVLFWQKRTDHVLRNLWLAITLSFAFYAPVVLFVDIIPMMGMMMIPKTCAYVWMIGMCYKAVQKPELKESFAAVRK